MLIYIVIVCYYDEADYILISNTQFSNDTYFKIYTADLLIH